jgi:hypothetical protein
LVAARLQPSHAARAQQRTSQCATISDPDRTPMIRGTRTSHLGAVITACLVH